MWHILCFFGASKRHIILIWSSTRYTHNKNRRDTSAVASYPPKRRKSLNKIPELKVIIVLRSECFLRYEVLNLTGSGARDSNNLTDCAGQPWIDIFVVPLGGHMKKTKQKNFLVWFSNKECVPQCLISIRLKN